MDESIEDLDPRAPALAFEALRPRLDALTELRVASTDILKATIFASAVGRAIQQPEELAAFRSLPPDRFDMQHVELLGTASMATWHTVMKLRSAAVLSTGARVPDEILSPGGEVKQRMLKVIDYVLGDVTGVGDQVADIRSGTGHMDLAEDLMRLADVYEAHATALAVDRIRYRAEDAVAARKLAHCIFQVLGDGPASDQSYWAGYQARAWTFLLATYDEVAAAGRWLFRHQDGDARFPSLYAIGRQPRRRRRERDEPTGDGELVAPAIPAA